MITLSVALSWLNQLDQSHLSQKSQFSIWQINDANVSETEKDKLIDAVIYSTRASDDPLEYAEVLVNCAKIQAERNHLSQAHILLDYARTLYEQREERLRQAVVLWMMSIIEWKLLENHTGHAHARSARTLMEQIGRETFLEKKDNRAWWIQDRIVDMEEDLATTPEESYFWLNQFEGTHLKPPSIQLSDSINAGLREKQFSRVYHLITSLLEITRNSADPMETAEAMAFCGLVNLQMGNTRDAIRLMRQSIALYQPESHHQTAIRWMLGMTQFAQPFEANQAVATCNQCIASIEQLKARAEHRNRPQERAWYESRAAIMRKVLNKKIQSFEKILKT